MELGAWGKCSNKNATPEAKFCCVHHFARGRCVVFVPTLCDEADNRFYHRIYHSSKIDVIYQLNPTTVRWVLERNAPRIFARPPLPTRQNGERQALRHDLKGECNE